MAKHKKIKLGRKNIKVSACTYPAKRLGIYKGQPIKEVLKIIA